MSPAWTTKSNMRWNLRSANAELVDRLAAQLGAISELKINQSRAAATLARLLVARDIRDAETAARFLSP